VEPLEHRVSNPMPCRGHRLAAQGANPGNTPGKRNPRSEGTLHSCVSRRSIPGLPMRCSFRTHLFFRMRFPGLAPWAGMHCPVGANCTMAFRSHVHVPNGHRVPTCQRGSVGATRTPCFESHAPLGQIARWHFDPMSMPRMGIASRRVSAAPLEPLAHRVSNLMPRWGKRNDDVSIRRVILSSWVR
jgi:hypothetical protein